MGNIDADSFVKYVRGQWAPAGFQISEVHEVPYREKVKALSDGFATGLTVGWDDAQPSNKTRVGIWFRPAPKGSINDLASLRSHYQGTLAQQGRGCRIHNCNTEFGPIFLFWETTAPLPQEAFGKWVAKVEELSALCFDSEGLDTYFEPLR